jgi:hypothetical protein
MAHNGFAALAQDRLQTFFPTESHADVSADSDLTGVRCSQFLSLFSFADIADKARKYLTAISG